MARLDSFGYGYLDKVCFPDGTPYPDDDFRSQYYDAPCLIAIYESENKAPGKKLVYFYPYEPGIMQRYLKTSIGTITTSGDEKFCIATSHSKYYFHIDRDCLNEIQKTELRLNTIACP